MSIKITNLGQEYRMDIPSSYEDICSKLELSNPKFIVNNDMTNLISSNKELQIVLEKYQKDQILVKMREDKWAVSIGNDAKIDKLYLEVYIGRYYHEHNNNRQLNPNVISTYFQYHCQNSKIRSWIHTVFVEYEQEAEGKVLSLKKEYRDGPDNSDYQKKQNLQIELDLTRTYGKQEPDENQLSKLRRISQAIGAHLFTTHSGEKRTERIGYVQGFQFIIAYLMTLTHDESDIFVLFVGLMERKQVPYLQPQDLTQEDIVSRKVDYGISDLYSGAMERLYNVNYIVKSLIEMYYKDLHNYMEKYCDDGMDFGIQTVLSLKLFCVGSFNVHDSSVMTTMFEKIVYGGYYAVIRLILSTYIAYKEEIKMLESREDIVKLMNPIPGSLWLNEENSLKPESVEKIIYAFEHLGFEDEKIYELEIAAWHKIEVENEAKREKIKKRKEAKRLAKEQKNGGMKKKRKTKRRNKRRKKRRKKTKGKNR
jgi:hypothetical protein